MVQVRNGEAQLPLDGKLAQQMQQTNGIRAAGDADDDDLPPPEKVMAGDVARNVGAKVGHRCSLARGGGQNKYAIVRIVFRRCLEGKRRKRGKFTKVEKRKSETLPHQRAAS